VSAISGTSAAFIAVLTVWPARWRAATVWVSQARVSGDDDQGQERFQERPDLDVTGQIGAEEEQQVDWQ